jgi:hypothetical protein
MEQEGVEDRGSAGRTIISAQMQFDTASFREKLSQLVLVRESIEKTSIWCCLFREDAGKLATE